MCHVAAQVDVPQDTQGSLASMASQASLDSSGLAHSLKAAHQHSRASLARLASADASGAAGEAAPKQAVSTGQGVSGFAAAAAVAVAEADAEEEAARQLAGAHAAVVAEAGLAKERNNSGLLRYRAPIDPQLRGKLESFDRKIGRAANALRVRRKRPPPSMLALKLYTCTLANQSL